MKEDEIFYIYFFGYIFKFMKMWILGKFFFLSYPIEEEEKKK